MAARHIFSSRSRKFKKLISVYCAWYPGLSVVSDVLARSERNDYSRVPVTGALMDLLSSGPGVIVITRRPATLSTIHASLAAVAVAGTHTVPPVEA